MFHNHWIRNGLPFLLWLISTAGLGFRFRLGYGFQTLWLHNIMLNMFPLTQTWIWITFPNGYCTHFRDRSRLYYIHFNQVSESKSEPMEKYCTVQKKSVSESESESGNGNKPLDNWGRNVRTHVTWLKRDNLPTDPSLARALASASVTSILTPDLGVNSGTTTLATISLTAARLRFCLMPYISARRLAAANT